MDTSEQYIEMRKRAVFDLPLKQTCGLNLHIYHGNVSVDYEGSFFVAWMDGHIDLPRQDQLQEMVFGISGDIQGQIWKIYEFATVNRATFPEVASMEQLWLAFVMKERFNKRWSGTDWE